MAASFFGHLHQQPTITAQGDLMYGEAIRNLKLDLDHKEKRYTLETLGATMALNMYEVCFSYSHLSSRKLAKQPHSS